MNHIGARELAQNCPTESYLQPEIHGGQTPRLKNDEVHVWSAALDREAPDVQRLRQILTVDEQARAERFYFQRDREHFIVARGLLRVILGHYLDIEPGQLRFCYSAYGKPALTPLPGSDTLTFNLSHSQGLALYAITRNREIGIDLERIRTDFDCEQVAERFFSAGEKAVLRALPVQVKHEAFFACWTRKEAYIKARGTGLSLPLDQFEVSLTPGEPAMLLNSRGDPQEVCHWSLQELRPVPGYVAALAVEGQGWQLRCRQWPA